MPQTPAAHVGLACVGAGHAWPQAPQFARSFDTSDSQPSATSWLQSARPGSHEPTTQPFEHAGTPPEAEQTFPHTLQFFVSEPRSASQPFAASSSQSANPALQWLVVHAPAAHVGSALASAQAWPHEPQLAADVSRSTHAPSQQDDALPPAALQSASFAQPGAHAAAAPLPWQTSPFLQSALERHATHAPLGSQCGFSPEQAAEHALVPVDVVEVVVVPPCGVATPGSSPEPHAKIVTLASPMQRTRGNNKVRSETEEPSPTTARSHRPGQAADRPTRRAAVASWSP
jgi:hypothetical protein